MDELTASKILQDQIRQVPNITTFTGYEIKEFLVGEKKQLEGVRFYDRKNEKEVLLKPDGVFMLVGLKPITAFAEDFVEMDGRGYILTDDKLMTNIPGVFAAGDCRSTATPQVASAVGEGAIVAVKIRDYLRAF